MAMRAAATVADVVFRAMRAVRLQRQKIVTKDCSYGLMRELEALNWSGAGAGEDAYNNFELDSPFAWCSLTS